MNKSLITGLSITAVLALLLITQAIRNHDDVVQGSSAEVALGPIEVWTAIDGYLESKLVCQVMSQLGGPATIVELVPDGTSVQEGDAVVRFDSAQLEREVLRLDRDYALAREEMNGLVNAKLPLELREIEIRVAGAREKLADELQAAEDDRDLLKEGFVSEKDLKSRESRVQSARAIVESIEQQADLTRKYIHPSLLERARATLNSAGQELDLARKQLSNCVVRATVPGVVGYRPLVVAGEFRTVRVGDIVFKSQPFMTISDMTNLVMYCDIPEAELTRFAPGRPAIVSPVAFPDIEINGRIETIGATARTAPGRGGSQKFFSVTIRLDTADPRLRSGMSAQARVLSYARKNAILVPRTAVKWEGGSAWCLVNTGGTARRTRVVTGMADETNYEVISGIEPGTRLIMR